MYSPNVVQFVSILSVVCCVQRDMPECSKNYEGLDAAGMDAPPPPHHYAGLGVHAPAAALDSDGYLLVVGDPKYGEHPQVSTDITLLSVRAIYIRPLTAKINAFDPMMYNSPHAPLQDELLC